MSSRRERKRKRKRKRLVRVFAVKVGGLDHAGLGGRLAERTG